ncbi:MAG: hypothetical protein RR844_00480 [Clostridium sp.]
MGNVFKLKIVTPEEDFFEGDVVSLNCETTDGRRGVLANHCAMLAAIIPTITAFEDASGKKYEAKTSQGVLKVKKNNAVILCDSASWENKTEV